ncbi:MAG: SDR family oxidoreductase [Pseudomonadota bacterium]
MLGGLAADDAVGYDVAISYAASGAEAEALAEDLRAKGVRAASVAADLLDDGAVAGLVPAAAAALGRPLDVLVNNASIFEHDSIDTLTLDSWERHHRSNLKAPVFLTQAFAAQVVGGVRDSAGEPLAAGSVINLIDQRVRKLTPEFMTYTLAKMGLWAFTQTAAQALAPDIRVNAIGPGPTLQGARQSAAHFKDQRANTVLGRGSDPADITRAVEFILDCPALTGQLLCIDGGQHLGWQTPDVLGVE